MWPEYAIGRLHEETVQFLTVEKAIPPNFLLDFENNRLEERSSVQLKKILRTWRLVYNFGRY